MTDPWHTRLVDVLSKPSPTLHLGIGASTFIINNKAKCKLLHMCREES